MALQRNSPNRRPRFFIRLVALACTLLAAAPAPGSAFRGPLPDVEVRALATSETLGLAGALAGRPAILLLTGEPGAAASPLEREAAELQREYGPWFSWVAVLSGPFTAAGVTALQDASLVRLERLYHDRDGALRASIGGVPLPALLLVDGDGTVRAVRTREGGDEGLAEIAGALRDVAASSRQRAAGIGDFRLPQVGGGLVSFLDVAGREGTMVVFLVSNCLPCARELEVVDFARDRRGGGVTFVAVFLDRAPDSRIRGFLAAAGASPDFVLRDPDLRLAGRFGIDAAPALIAVDAGGRIALSRVGYREEDRDDLYAGIMTAFDVAAPEEGGRLAEARRLHADAVIFLREGKAGYALLYQERIGELLPGNPSVHLRIAEAAIAAGDRAVASRNLASYLAENPGAYGNAEVRETLAGLVSAGR